MLIEARNQGAEQAVFIIYQFVSTKTNNIKSLQNKADFVEFMELLTSTKMLYPIGTLYGPIVVSDGGRVPSGIPLYIGYISVPII
jgi:hypothetical protein